MFRNTFLCGLICLVFLTATNGQDWKAIFDPPNLIVHMYSEKTAQLSITYDKRPSTEKFRFHLRSEDTEIATVNKTIQESDFINVNGVQKWTGNFTISTILVSRIKIYVELETIKNNTIIIQRSESELALTITRDNRPFDYILFVYAGFSIISLYVTIGMDFHWDQIKLLFENPITSLVPLLTQFVIMPLIGYGLGYRFFSDTVGLHLGIFFTSACPIGAGSHFMLQILKTDTSKTNVITVVSTLATFILIPIWLLTVGKLIFDSANIEVPYGKMFGLLAGLIVLFLLGILMQRCLPPTSSQHLETIARAKSNSYVIVLLACCANFYIFKIHTWKIILAGFLLSLIGYIFGFIIGIITRRKSEEKTDVAYDFSVCIELGLLNTGLAIVFLKFCLSQPETDQALTAAVSVTLGSFIIFIILFILECIWIHTKGKGSQTVSSPSNNNSTEVN